MNRSYIYIIICLFIYILSDFTVPARTIRDFFISEPDDIFIIIDKNTRLDLLDYYDGGRIVSTQNALGDDTQLIKVSDNYLSIQLSESSTVEMQLIFPSKKDTVIVVNHIVYTPVPDSKLMFYNKDWEKLNNKKFIKEPTIESFINIESLSFKKKKDILDMVEFPLISYSINPQKNKIVASNGLKEYLTKEEYNKIAPYFKNNIEFILKGKKYIPNSGE